MDDDERLDKLQEFIVRYVESSPPIYWVNWLARCRDDASRKQLESVLFDDGRLRQLTNIHVKEEVLHVIFGSEALTELVAEDFAADVERAREESKGD